MTNKDSKVGKEGLEGKVIFKSIFFLALIIAITFVGADCINYWQGWIYNGLNIIFIILSYFLLPRELIEERLKHINSGCLTPKFYATRPTTVSDTNNVQMFNMTRCPTSITQCLPLM